MIHFRNVDWHGSIVTKRSAAFYGLLLAMASLADAVPASPSLPQNTTASVLEGIQNHGNPKLLCVPSRWTHITVFFAANFVAHAATVRSQPGGSVIKNIFMTLLALFLPTAGLVNGLDAILRHAATRGSPLQQAKWAGALCEVVRSDLWKPRAGDSARGVELPIGQDCQDPSKRSSIARFSIPTSMVSVRHNPGYGRMLFRPNYSKFKFFGQHVHGSCYLSDEYRLAVIPTHGTVSTFEEKEDENTREASPIQPDPSGHHRPRSSVKSDISSSYNFSKGIAALFQTIYATVTLVKTRGDQIQRYGYAAFGFTVAPYLVMSIVNLLGTLLTPDYSAIYLIESDIMKEAIKRGCYFKGTVGILDYDMPSIHSCDVSFESNDGDPDQLLIQRNCPDSGADNVVDATRVPQADESGDSEQESTNVTLDKVLVAAGCCDLPDPDIFWDNFRKISKLYLPAIIIGLISVIINGIMSRFDAGHSSDAERAWTMVWLAFGIVYGVLSHALLSWLVYAVGESHVERDKVVVWRFFIPALSVLLIPGIGGFVVVGKMLLEYGNCILK